MGRRGRVTVGGVSLAYECWGDPADPPVVLLHALGASAAGWGPVASVLAEHRYVCAVDLRGHGASAHTDRYSLELMRDDVVGLVETLRMRRAVLVGHSLGGMVAYLAAAERPDLFSRLVLEETPLPVPSDPPRVVPERPTRVAFDWAAVEAVYAQRNRPDPAWWDRLPAVEVPVLVVSGGPASHLRPHEQRALADRFPDARLVTIEAGHLVHAARPVEFVDVVTGFLER
jgi:3-oxoadipate enol-lactonase